MNMGQFNELALLIEQYLPKLLAVLALGLRGREIAARESNQWIESLKTKRTRGTGSSA